MDYGKILPFGGESIRQLFASHTSFDVEALSAFLN